MTDQPPADGRRTRRLPWLAVLLAVSLAARLVLAAQGGQFFFGDENRHERGVDLYLALRSGDLAGVRAVLGRPEHAGYTAIAAAVTGLQHLGAQLTPWGDWSRPENITFTWPIGAGWLSLFSVLNLWLVHRVARRSGATASEADWAALLAACCNCLFYYSRHFLPYDAALTFALAAILAGIDGRRSVLCGLLAGAAWQVYNGYWFLVPVVIGLHAMAGTATWHVRLARLWKSGAGAGLALLVPGAIGMLAAGRGYWQTMVAFSGTVNQGLFSEGWSLPWEYFWQAEGVAGLLLVAAIGAALVITARGREDARGLRWLAAAGGCYALLVLFSNVLQIFVVYARTVRPVAVFFCLAGGWALARLLAGRSGAFKAAAAAACCLVAAANLAPHFGRVFPRELEVRVLREFGNPKHTLSFSGSIYIPLALPVGRPELALVNAQLIYPVRDFIGVPEGRTLLSVAHPLAYLPFQYESHAPRERALLRRHPPRIALIRLADPAAQPADLPEPLRFTAADRPDGHDRRGK